MLPSPKDTDILDLDWFLIQAETQRNHAYVGLSGASAAFNEYLSPLNQAYPSRLNPVFLSDCADLLELQRSACWLARDGLLPLLWFFSRFPEPRSFRGRILVAEDHGACVPPAWRPHVGTYRLGGLPASRLPKAEAIRQPEIASLLIVGINSPAYCRVDAARELLRSAAKVFNSKRQKKPRVRICLFPKSEPLALRSDIAHHASQLLIEVCNAFPGSVESISPAELAECSSFAGWGVLDLNERYLCADSMLVHQVLNRGGGLLEPALSSSYDDFEPTSLFHGFGIRSKIAASSSKVVAKVQEALSSPASRCFPWALWFRHLIAYQLSRSLTTGQPDFLRRPDGRILPLLRRHALGGVDSIHLDEFRLKIAGWCIDADNRSLPESVVVFRGDRLLPAKFTRHDRYDVSGWLHSVDASLGASGFLLEVPREALELDGSDDSPIHAFGIFGRGIAAELSEIRFLRSPHGEITPAPVPTPPQPAALPIQFSLKGTLLQLLPMGAQYTLVDLALPDLAGFVDSCASVDRGTTICGWAGDPATGIPADSILVTARGKSSGWLVPLQRHRPDLKISHGAGIEAAGFDALLPGAAAPGELRAFALYPSQRARELKIPLPAVAAAPSENTDRARA